MTPVNASLPPSSLQRVRRLLLDRAAVYSLATKVLQAAGGAVSAVLVIRYFSPELQGFYYTFANLLALQVFLELGLSAVVTTFAAHEWSKLGLGPTRAVQGEPQAEARLRSLARKVAAWYAMGAAVLLLALPPVGLWFLDSPTTPADIVWRQPWIALCALTALNFLLAPVWAVLIGCGQIGPVNAYRLVETLLRYLTLWILIERGASLWAAVGASALPTIAAVGFIGLRYRHFLASLLRRPGAADFNWRRELWPLQARIAVSWISGYFAFAVFTPAMFYFQGPVEAGRMGLTWAVITGLSGMAATWLQAQAPALTTMVAMKRFAEIDGMLYRTGAIALAVSAAGAAICLLGLAWLRHAYPSVADRFLPLGALAIFLIAECLHQVSMAQSTYLRAFKQEPFLGVSVTSGLIIAGGTLLSSRALGAYGVAASYLAGILVALAWGTRIFVTKRALWTDQHR